MLVYLNFTLDGFYAFDSLMAYGEGSFEIQTDNFENFESQFLKEASDDLKAPSKIVNALASPASTDNLEKIPNIGRLGPHFVSSEPVNLTDFEAEYRVQVIKHIFSSCMALEYRIVNTVPSHILSDLTVDFKATIPLNIIDASLLETLETNQNGLIFVVFDNQSSNYPCFQVNSSLKFKVSTKDNPLSAFPEKYTLHSFEVSVKDYILPTSGIPASLKHVLKDAFTLTALDSVEDAKNELFELIGGHRESDKNMLRLSGLIYPDQYFLCKLLIEKNKAGEVTLDVEILASHSTACTLVMNLIA